MSYVSTVTILIGDYDKEEMIVNHLNNYFTEKYKLGEPFKYIEGGTAAGTKYPERRLLWAGINYLETENFIEFIKSLNIEDSVLTIANPNHDQYTVVPLGVETQLEIK